MNFIALASQFFTFFFCVCFFCFIAFIIYASIADRMQKKHSLRRNYPVIARGRWFMEYFGHFFRSYTSNDREDYPFSKVERVYAYKAAKGNKRTEAFGSTLNYKDMDFAFINSQFPYTGNKKDPDQIIFGEKTKNPYKTNSRINISAMSYGALSDVAILSLSQGAAKGNFLMNTGEGGLSKFHIDGGAPIIFQIGTAKYGCANDDLTLNEDKLKELADNDQIKMFEIKLSQGAKPGKGGILPADKVTKEIAEARNIEIGKASISPSAHKEITNMDNLIDFIKKVKENTGKPVGIKLCLGSEQQFHDMIKKLDERVSNYLEHQDDVHLIYPDFITVDSADGGTGAAPLAHMDAMGMNLKESLIVVDKVLKEFNLRKKIKIIASGKLLTPVHAAWAFANGADSINIGRGFLFSLGCIQARVCSKNKCPTGITSHQKKYTRGLIPEEKNKRVFHYHKHLTEDLMDIAHSCGVESFDKLNQSHIRKLEIIKVIQ